MTQEFKVGDRVRLCAVAAAYWGETGTVSKVAPGHARVSMDSGRTLGASGDPAFRCIDLALIDPAFLPGDVVEVAAYPGEGRYTVITMEEYVARSGRTIPDGEVVFLRDEINGVEHEFPELLRLISRPGTQPATTAAPESVCQNRDPDTGWPCRLRPDHRERCETGAGRKFGESRAQAGDKRHTFGGVTLDLPEKGPSPKPVEIPAHHKMAAGDWARTHGLNVRKHNPALTTLGAMHQDTVHSRIPRRWCQKARRS